ncbi:MAG: hypothetical protein J0I28_09410 [Caulobacterales bacterium]|nr:hypothetical protein [Caulobacterales bacterium]
MLLFALMLAAAPLGEAAAAAGPVPPPISAPGAIDIMPAPLAIPAPFAAVDLAALDDMRGGDGSNAIIVTEQTLKAVNTGNSVIGETVVSGDVTLGSGAFSGYNGIGNFAINTGNNNNLQSSVSVSIIVTPSMP